MRRHNPLVSASCPNLAEVRPATNSGSRRTFDDVPPAKPGFGDAVHMSPSLINVQRAMSASRPQRPRTATELHGRQASGPGDVILVPLPPPYVEPKPLEEDMEEELHRDARLKLLEARLRLMEENGRPVSAPAGSLPEVTRRKVGRLVGGPRRRRQSPDLIRHRSPDNDRLQQAFSGTWGELNPFDPVQNPRAHLLQQQRAASDSPERQRRSPSLGRNLESFRPSFRTEWLVALRRELLLGQRQENSKLRGDFKSTIASAVTELKDSYEAAVTAIRKDYADAAADIRHDFIDCFINGDIGGMIDAANKKKRIVDVDFTPIFEEMSSIKQHVSASDSDVMEAIRTMRKDQASLRQETSRLVIDMAETVSNDIKKVTGHVEHAVNGMSTLIEEANHRKASKKGMEVDLTPVLEAINRIEDVDLTPMLAALEAARNSEINIQADIDILGKDIKKELADLNAIKDAQEGILNEIGQMSIKSEADNFILLNAVSGTGLDIGEQIDDKIGSMTADIHKVSDASVEAISNQRSTLTKLSDDISSNSQLILQAVKEAGEEHATVDFSPVMDALAKLDLEPVMDNIDARYKDTCKHIDQLDLDLQPVLHAVNALDFKAAVAPVLESVSKVMDVAVQIESQQGLMAASLVQTQAIVVETAVNIPPPTDLSPVLSAIDAIDVQPQVHIDLQGVLDAVEASGEAVRAETDKVLLAISTGTVHEDLQKLADSIAKMDSNGEESLSAVTQDLNRLREELKEDIGKASRKSIASIAAGTADAFNEFARRLTAARSEGVQELLDAIAAIKMPELNLDPVLDALAALDSSSVLAHINVTHSETLSAIQDASANLDSSVQQAALQSDAVWKNGLTDLYRLDGESKSLQQSLLEIVTRIDGKPPVNLDPLHDLVTKIDAKPPVDLQPLLDAVSAIELNPVIKVDTRPVIDAMSAGLARIEIAWAQVDLTDVTNLIKKIDTRLLEAIVKIDAKDPNRSPNFIWSSQANRWT